MVFDILVDDQIIRKVLSQAQPKSAPKGPALPIGQGCQVMGPGGVE